MKFFGYTFRKPRFSLRSKSRKSRKSSQTSPGRPKRRVSQHKHPAPVVIRLHSGNKSKSSRYNRDILAAAKKHKKSKKNRK